ncbi:copper homeostasis CutC domain-containing protein [Parachaetomium inaequale]|uniref:Copper homeostasis protein cutC homolog n=1 Tax=Parachaetomium inaequale TaxID=2588326 RepID=A0AAN6PIV3_9PEZI|nr:copper homeostasis CutC domain-containing protein [Parachaetomium inaequale]
MVPGGCPRLEVPIFGPGDGLTAVSLGASRLELNQAGSYAVGGTTPTLPELTALLSSLDSESIYRPTIRIMIRPRGPPPPSSLGAPNTPQDFIYTPTEFSTMASSITEFTASGLPSPHHGDGFVFGVLCHNPTTGKVELDVERNKKLVELAGQAGLKCVLHRAVDELLSDDEGDVGGVMEGVRGCGFEGVLTSGGKGDAVGNLEGLRGVGVEVIVGGGVRRGNLRGLVEGLRGGEGGGRFDEEEARGLAEGLRELRVVLLCEG